MNVAMDVTPLRLTRAGTARYIRNLAHSGLEVRPVGFGGPGEQRCWRATSWWYPFRLSARGGGTDVLHCTTCCGPLRPAFRPS